MVSSTPRPHFTPGKDPVPILQEVGWAPGPVWTGGKSRPHRDSIPDRPARSQSLYRLNYQAQSEISKFVYCTIFRQCTTIYQYCDIIYRVIQKEYAVLWEMIVCVILSKKVHMNMGPILKGYRDMVKRRYGPSCEHEQQLRNK